MEDVGEALVWAGSGTTHLSTEKLRGCGWPQALNRMEMSAAQRGPTVAGCESQQRRVSRTIFLDSN
jgi:hypothetical protein